MDSIFDVFCLWSDIAVPAGAIWDNNNPKRVKLSLKYRLGLAALDSTLQYLINLRKFISCHPGFKI